MLFVALMGIGMGLSIPSFLVAVQSSVERRHLGTATSTLQFSRSIGGTLGVTAMGAALSYWLAASLRASGLDPSLVTQLLDPLAGAQALHDSGVRLAMASAIDLVFWIAFGGAALALVATLFMPHRDLEEELPKPAESDPRLMSADQEIGPIA
jgi:MFS family permease